MKERNLLYIFVNIYTFFFFAIDNYTLTVNMSIFCVNILPNNDLFTRDRIVQ